MSMRSTFQELEVDDDDDTPDDQMDWMGERLRALIEQGKQALGKEIVVVDDTVNDFEKGVEDDGSHDWEDDDAHTPTKPRRVHASPSRQFTSPAPSLSRSVSQRDLHAPLSSPYQLPAYPASKLPTTPSASTSNLSRTSAPAPSTSFGSSSSRHGSSPPVAILRYGAIEPTQSDRERYWQAPITQMAGPLNASDDDLVSGSPEMRKFMEQARRARLGR